MTLFAVTCHMLQAFYAKRSLNGIWQAFLKGLFPFYYTRKPFITFLTSCFFDITSRPSSSTAAAFPSRV